MGNGKIILVGLGPGSEQHMSVRARQAIAEADVIIGYATYIKLVQELVAGKQVIRKGMTEELDRCHEALAHARQGKIVALVSSGDSGVYGMAGPTYEVLLQSGWKPDDGIGVEVVPGSTALNSCAALVGAPLTHDFCSISLSDLLTPWPVIARRLEAAARGDFVVGLYNPKSGRRTGQIVEAQRILLQHRSPSTPVALIKSAYRSRQRIEHTTLAHMAECDIGMLTTVLIGNSHTFVREGLMVTPRGYANKYDALTGEAHDGERAGRSLSMGLTGWKACVRRYLRDDPQSTLQDAARHFEAPLVEMFAAVAEANGDDHAGANQAVAAQPGQLEEVFELIRTWGKLRAVVRSATSSVAELFITARDLQRKGDRLNFMNEHFHLHVPWNNEQQVWFTARNNMLHGVHFVNGRRQLEYSLLLTRNTPFDLALLQRHVRLTDHAPAPVESNESSTDE